MVISSEQLAPTKQKKLLEDGADLISAKFYRGVQDLIRKEINDHVFTPDEIDFSAIQKKMSQAMTIIFLVSSGKIPEPSAELTFAEQEDMTFRFDLPFQQAIDAWTKVNPAQEALLQQVQGGTGAMAQNFSFLLRDRIKNGVSDILQSGKPLTVMARDLRTKADEGAAQYMTALRTGVATAQNAGHQIRMMGNPNIALYQYRGPDNSHTTGKPGGVYATSKNGNRNPGHCYDMNGFLAIASHWIWRKIWPPNHFNCHFKVVSISWTRAREMGYLTKSGEVMKKYVDPKIPSFITSGEWPEKGFDQSPLSMLNIAA